MRINSRLDYELFLKQDASALGVPHSIKQKILRTLGLKHEIWEYQVRLRRVEYILNCNRSTVRLLIAKYRLRSAGIRLGFSIPPNTFGPGLSIAHRGDIIVNSHARIGSNCRVHAGVNIGTAAGEADATPVIGNNCYLGPGAKLFGRITIGEATAVGANAVVNRSFPDGGCTLGGVPARVIGAKSARGLHVNAASEFKAASTNAATRNKAAPTVISPVTDCED
ncbi:hypothetical protein CH292_05955 [Rhodococcus sp. 14-2470-1a]|nr:hypothetical protein CH292_05955 [Rhodococcus sp. 14-2470-1a]